MMAPAVRQISVCADDFGANDAACAAIIDLAGLGTISATSCLVDGPATARHARALRATGGFISIGLHLDLTEFAPADVRASLRRWLWRGFVLRDVDPQQLRGEVRRQLLRFEYLFAQAPAFADGHCHVHQIPGVREALLDELSKRYGRSVAVRSTRALHPSGLKGRFIEELGGRSLHAMLGERRLHSNSDFAGAYDFSTRRDYAQRMRHWLAHIADGGLIMCHPERQDRAGAPPSARAAEHGFLSSSRWRELLGQHGVRLNPFVAA
jgi:predicted glycoside hydrolase/deacetylase ChbG (UPF0249 family)